MSALLRTAKRKAKYGHKEWLYWKDINGNEHAEVKTAQSINKAKSTLDKNKHWKENNYFLHINTCGDSMIVTYDIAEIMFKNASLYNI